VPVGAQSNGDRIQGVDPDFYALIEPILDAGPIEPT
jgi:hypothetical protein